MAETPGPRAPLWVELGGVRLEVTGRSRAIIEALMRDAEAIREVLSRE